MNASSDVHCRSNGPELIAGFISPYRRRVRSFYFLVSYPNHQHPPFFFLFLGFSPVVEKIPAQQSCFFWKNWIFASNFPLLRIADVNARRWPGKGGPVFFVCVSSFDRAPSFIYNSRPGGKRSGKHLAPVLSIVLVIKQLPVDCSAAV